MKIIIQIALLLLLISGTAFGQEKELPKRPILYLFVDKLPTFDYNYGIIGYVVDSLRNLYFGDLEGGGIISLIVKKDGSVTKVKKVKGLGNFDVDIIRIIENMPKWTPGELNSEKVDVLLYVPIKYGAFGKYEEEK